MDLDALRVFTKVAELASFTHAAAQLHMPKARASLRVQALEAELGIRLLHRTTRTVRLTPDGEQVLARARRLLVDADELTALFQAPRALRGIVRIDLPNAISRDVIIPRLPDFLAAHPQLELQISTTDRRVELIKEGFDLVLRVGNLADSGLAARRLGSLAMANVVSPTYVARHGLPHTLAELDRHLVVHYSLALGADPPSFDLADRAIPMRALVTVNSSDAYRAACDAGLGIIQVPRVGVRRALAEGTLLEILPEHTCPAMPVSLVHAHGRNVPRRVRAVMTWLTQVVQGYLAA